MSKIPKNKVIFFIDEVYDSRDDVNNFVGVCVVFIQQNRLDSVKESLNELKFTPNYFIGKGAGHFSEDNITNRQKIAELIYKMPVSAYVGFATNNIPENKDDKNNLIYKKLLPEILKPLKLKFLKKYNEPYFEINFQNITNKIDRDYDFFEEVVQNEVSFSNATLKVLTKDSENLTILPDYFLGFFQRYIKYNEDEKWPEQSLKLLSAKVGLFLLLDNQTNRHNRFERGDDFKELLELLKVCKY